ncbi:hypothetical protein D3C87_1927320 [compost metagenome]
MVDLVGHLALHQHIAREELALGVDLPAAADFHDLLGRHDHVFKQVLELLLRNLETDVFRHLALEVRIRLNDVPALGHKGSPLPIN